MLTDHEIKCVQDRMKAFLFNRFCLPCHLYAGTCRALTDTCDLHSCWPAAWVSSRAQMDWAHASTWHCRCVMLSHTKFMTAHVMVACGMNPPRSTRKFLALCVTEAVSVVSYMIRHEHTYHCSLGKAPSYGKQTAEIDKAFLYANRHECSCVAVDWVAVVRGGSGAHVLWR